MNAQEFAAAVGHPPELDDLERANCPHAGTAGHNGCGVCEHGKPVFTCEECFVKSAHGLTVRYQHQSHTVPKS